MITYQPYSDFTAQSRTVTALMNMYAQLERSDDFKIALTPIVVFLAFSIESYINSIGARKIAIWDELERLPWKNKIIILHKTVEKEVVWGEDPLQFAVEVFKIRDKLAHGKPERVIGPIFKDPNHANSYIHNESLEPDWYKKVTPEWALQAKDRFRLLMTYLAEIFNLHESDHLHVSTGGLLIDDGIQA